MPQPSASAGHPRRCPAPSLELRDDLDARDEAALGRCVSPTTGPAEAANRCGQSDAIPALDLPRLAAALPPLDEATKTHLLEIAQRGRKLGRNPRAFGLIGDSMTVSGAFLRQVPERLAPAVKASLRTTVDGDGSRTIIDYYRGAETQRVRGMWRDSFGASRAARVGARAEWATRGGDHSPLMLLIKQLSPAVAVVLFGGNDAAFRTVSLDLLTADFARDLERALDALEAAGVVPILNTVARHGRAPGFDDCGKRGNMTYWRIAVQTNAISARVVEIACRRHLPLIDLRYALDTAVGRGIGSDGIHPSAYVDGAGVLDSRGMRCGYNVRNYVTLLMLKRVKELLAND